MANRDIDDIPEPDTPATASERAQASSFAELVDRMIAGGEFPPAMASEERTLLETATVVRASTHEVALPSERGAALIEQALRQAVSGLAGAGGEPDTTERTSREGGAEVERGAGAAADALPDVLSLDAHRARRAGRAATLTPWVVAAVCAAAALFFALRPVPSGDGGSGEIAQVEVPTLAEIHTSRPSDPLVGRIAPEDADKASARLDVIYTDRMVGYRDLTLRGGRR